jgi:hypothetical protein
MEEKSVGLILKAVKGGSMGESPIAYNMRRGKAPIDPMTR